MADENQDQGQGNQASTTATVASQVERQERQAEARKGLQADSEKLAARQEKQDAKLAEPANMAPATEVAASGAIMEPEAAEAVDFSHPAVDNNPRAGTTVRQNVAEFNDPTLSASEATQANLDALKSTSKR